MRGGEVYAGSSTYLGAGAELGEKAAAEEAALKCREIS